MSEKQYISKEKYDELEAELKDLKTSKRKQVAERLEYARSLGDLSENAEYHAARDEQGEVESRIEELEELFKNAEIISHNKKTDFVEIGSTVKIKKSTGETFTYTIVGKEETDLDAGKLSYGSPLGESLLGKKKGDNFDFETPKGNINYIVVDIS